MEAHEMLGFIHSFERSFAAIALAGLSGPRRQQGVRVVRQTSHGTVDRLVAALATVRRERDDAERRAAALSAEVLRLRAAVQRGR